MRTFATCTAGTPSQPVTLSRVRSSASPPARLVNFPVTGWSPQVAGARMSDSPPPAKLNVRLVNGRAGSWSNRRSSEPFARFTSEPCISCSIEPPTPVSIPSKRSGESLRIVPVKSAPRPICALTAPMTSPALAEGAPAISNPGPRSA